MGRDNAFHAAAACGGVNLQNEMLDGTIMPAVQTKMKETQFEISLNDHKTIDALQKQFNGAFPYLKIEFFKKPHREGQGTGPASLYDTGMEVGRIRRAGGPGRLSVSSRMTVHAFEQQLREQCGLYVQVFRKSGNIWLETSATDNWTLEEQNEEGRSLAQHLRTERENPEDHDMY
jgi:hypothetical protein